jgi:hypothetical protein
MSHTLDSITLNRNNLISKIESMPQEFSAAELIEEILLEEDIKSAFEDIKNGNVYSHEEMKKIIASWQK